jgi:hypothetical protein
MAVGRTTVLSIIALHYIFFLYNKWPTAGEFSFLCFQRGEKGFQTDSAVYKIQIENAPPLLSSFIPEK